MEACFAFSSVPGLKLRACLNNGTIHWIARNFLVSSAGNQCRSVRGELLEHERGASSRMKPEKVDLTLLTRLLRSSSLNGIAVERELGEHGH
jgi:hypothetical protein